MDKKTVDLPALTHHHLTLDKTQVSLVHLQRYLQAATSINTRRAYQQDIRHFLSSGALLPSTPEAIISYLQHYAPILNPRTLARRLSAIKQWHLSQGFSDPTAHLLVRKTMTGVKNIHGKPKDKALPLQLEQLILITRYLKNLNTTIAWRNMTLIQLGFFGAFRRSELTMICFEHLRYVSQGLEILIPRSKTDQGGEGLVCAIPFGKNALCPVTSLNIWCQKANIEKGPIFRRVNKIGKISHQAIAPHHVNIIIKSAARACHFSNPDQYSSHSLRRGFATTASKQGASLASIMQQGRWQHTGTAVGYMEEAKRFETNAAGLLLNKSKL